MPSTRSSSRRSTRSTTPMRVTSVTRTTRSSSKRKSTSKTRTSVKKQKKTTRSRSRSKTPKKTATSSASRSRSRSKTPKKKTSRSRATKSRSRSKTPKKTTRSRSRSRSKTPKSSTKKKKKSEKKTASASSRRTSRRRKAAESKLEDKSPVAKKARKSTTKKSNKKKSSKGKSRRRKSNKKAEAKQEKEKEEEELEEELEEEEEEVDTDDEGEDMTFVRITRSRSRSVARQTSSTRRSRSKRKDTPIPKSSDKSSTAKRRKKSKKRVDTPIPAPAGTETRKKNSTKSKSRTRRSSTSNNSDGTATPVPVRRSSRQRSTTPSSSSPSSLSPSMPAATRRSSRASTRAASRASDSLAVTSSPEFTKRFSRTVEQVQEQQQQQQQQQEEEEEEEQAEEQEFQEPGRAATLLINPADMEDDSQSSSSSEKVFEKLPTLALDVISEDPEAERKEKVETLNSQMNEILARYKQAKKDGPDVVVPKYDELVAALANPIVPITEDHLAHLNDLNVELENRQEQVKRGWKKWFRDLDSFLDEDKEELKKKTTRSVKANTVSELTPEDLRANVADLTDRQFFEKAKQIINRDSSRVSEKGGAENGTALCYACIYRDLSMVKFCLRKGASVCARTKKGDTPLHLALRHQFVVAIPYLLRAGAASTVDSINDNNRTPLDIARLKNVNLHTTGLSRYGTCTYATTKTDFREQIMYECLDCGIKDDEGICDACVERCHKDCKTQFINGGIPINAYCDCGHRGKALCKALKAPEIDLVQESSSTREEGLPEQIPAEKVNQADVKMQSVLLGLLGELMEARKERDIIAGAAKHLKTPSHSSSELSSSKDKDTSSPSNTGSSLKAIFLFILGMCCLFFGCMIFYETLQAIRVEKTQDFFTRRELAKAHYQRDCVYQHMNAWRKAMVFMEPRNESGHLIEDDGCIRYIQDMNREFTPGLADASGLMQKLAESINIFFDTLSAKVWALWLFSSKQFHGPIGMVLNWVPGGPVIKAALGV